MNYRTDIIPFAESCQTEWCYYYNNKKSGSVVVFYNILLFLFFYFLSHKKTTTKISASNQQPSIFLSDIDCVRSIHRQNKILIPRYTLLVNILLWPHSIFQNCSPSSLFLFYIFYRKNIYFQNVCHVCIMNDNIQYGRQISFSTQLSGSQYIAADESLPI